MTADDAAAPRYEVVVDRYAGGGLYELEERTTYYVVERATREVRLTFTSESSSSYDGGAWRGEGTSGVYSVVLADDGENVLVEDHTGVRRVPIPG